MGVERVVYVPDNDFEEYGSEEYKEKWEEKIRGSLLTCSKGYCDVEIGMGHCWCIGPIKKMPQTEIRPHGICFMKNRQIWKMKEGEDEDD